MQARDLVVLLGLWGCGEATPVTIEGEVWGFQAADPLGGVDWRVGAGFRPRPPVADCPRVRLEDCDIITCGSLPSLAEGVLPTAGKVTVDVNGFPHDLTPDASGHYATVGGLGIAELRWKAGQAIYMSAEGADISIFSYPVRASSPVVLMKPRFDPQQMTIPLGSDYEFAWTGGDEGELAVALLSTGFENLSGGSAAQCHFRARAGVGRIPRAALSAIGAGLGSMRVDVLSEEPVPIQGAAVFVRTRTVGTQNGDVVAGLNPKQSHELTRWTVRLTN